MPKKDRMAATNFSFQSNAGEAMLEAKSAAKNSNVKAMSGVKTPRNTA